MSEGMKISGCVWNQLEEADERIEDWKETIEDTHESITVVALRVIEMETNHNGRLTELKIGGAVEADHQKIADASEGTELRNELRDLGYEVNCGTLGPEWTITKTLNVKVPEPGDDATRFVLEGEDYPPYE